MNIKGEQMRKGQSVMIKVVSKNIIKKAFLVREEGNKVVVKHWLWIHGKLVSRNFKTPKTNILYRGVA